MSRYTDQALLLSNQYRDAAKLEARIALHERFSTNPGSLNEWLFDKLRLPAACDVLELGCGTGRLWQENAQRVPAGWRLLLSDLSPGMLANTRKRLTDVLDNVSLRRLDAQDLPFPNGSFDGVIANYMLYHVPDRPKALAQIARVLRPAGTLYAATNGQAHMAELEPFYRLIDPEYRRFTEPFNLENGEQQLAAWFERVELHRFEDGLVVTEAEPLLHYLLSTLSLTSVSAHSVERLQTAIEQQIENDGLIQVSKSTGVFVAHHGGETDQLFR